MMTIVPRNALRQATGIARHDHNPARSTYREEKTVQTMGSTAHVLILQMIQFCVDGDVEDMTLSSVV